MLGDRILKIKKYFGVELHDYGRTSSGILLSSGCGIGLALMDLCPELNWFCDIDNYRRHSIDWESIAAILAAGRPDVLALVGWFSIDRPVTFEKIGKTAASHCTVVFYKGGETSLVDIIDQIKATKKGRLETSRPFETEI